MVGQVRLEKLIEWYEQHGAGIILAHDSVFLPAEKAATKLVIA